MSRGQEGDTVSTANNQNKTYFNNAQNSYANAQTDINNYDKQLSDYKGQVAKFSASNPFTKGGEFQTDTNRIVANTADANARAAGTTLQGQALRTGQNTAGSIAATEAMERQGTRDVGSEEAGAEQSRVGQEAGYNKSALEANQGVLGATAAPVGMETTIAGQEGNLGEGALGIEQKAGETPSWGEDFNAMLNKSAEAFAGRPKS